jgi:hypothetical protein
MEPLRPTPADEGTHPPGPEPLWNESWYFDGISDDGSVGVYLRTGRVPNQGHCLFSAFVAGPGRPTVMLAHTSAPLPPADDPAQAIHVDALDAEQHCEEPLRRFRVAVAGTAQSFDDPAGILRGEQGRDVRIGLELAFETVGIPYLWRRSTRYEIPCRVTGTVRVGDEEIAFAGPGQRDHSWGARDWWASDWVWSALHLDDGTHTHAVGVPQVPKFAVGYVQRDGQITEVGSVATTEEVTADGLVSRATIASGPDPELELALEPLAYGPVLLVSPDGRVSHFVRAMCRVDAGDGRSGLGWVEWNRNQRE